MGKFEGDPFEKLQVRLVGTDLFVRVGTGEVIDFNLAEKSFAFEDIAEPRTLILDYRKTPIVLKVTSCFVCPSLIFDINIVLYIF